MTKGVRRRCPCLQPVDDDVQELDYCHGGLVDVPPEVFLFERTLEELYLDANRIKDLPRPLFHCHGLRKLGLSDNEVQFLPPAIASLINLQELNVSKNGIVSFPDTIKGCRNLTVVEASANPLGKLPDGFTQLINLEELYLNDTLLGFLPANFGRLSRLRILELRENHLRTLPKSMSRMTDLARLDIGQNDFLEVPEVVGFILKLKELWCDCNQIGHLPSFLGNLHELTCIDASNNNIEWVAKEIEGCYQLTDLALSSNWLQMLPDTIGQLKHLSTLKVDDNHLACLPDSIGKLVNLEELVASQNDLRVLPSTIGYLRKLHSLNLDDNSLEELPQEMGSCIALTVLSVHGNCLKCIPHELGHIPHLRVVNLSSNCIQNLPFSITKLRELQALWLSDNQNKPLVPLQSDIDPFTGQRILTCFMLPQQQCYMDEAGSGSDTDSFRLSSWEEERKNKQQIKFAFDDELEHPGRLVRAPTPYPKELARHAKKQALKLKAKKVLQNNEPNLFAEEQKVRVKEAKVTKPFSPYSNRKEDDMELKTMWPSSSEGKCNSRIACKENIPYENGNRNLRSFVCSSRSNLNGRRSSETSDCSRDMGQDLSLHFSCLSPTSQAELNDRQLLVPATIRSEDIQDSDRDSTETEISGPCSTLGSLRRRQLCPLPNAAHPTLVGIVQRASPPPSPTRHGFSPTGSGNLLNRAPSPPISGRDGRHLLKHLPSPPPSRSGMTGGVLKRMPSPPPSPSRSGWAAHSLPYRAGVPVPAISNSVGIDHQAFCRSSSSPNFGSKFQRLSPPLPVHPLNGPPSNLIHTFQEKPGKMEALCDQLSSPTSGGLFPGGQNDLYFQATGFVGKDDLVLLEPKGCYRSSPSPTSHNRKPPPYYVAAAHNKQTDSTPPPYRTPPIYMGAETNFFQWPAGGRTSTSRWSRTSSQSSTSPTCGDVSPLLVNGKEDGFFTAHPVLVEQLPASSRPSSSGSFVSNPLASFHSSNAPPMLTQDKPSGCGGLPIIVPTPHRPVGGSSSRLPHTGNAASSWFFGLHRNAQVFPVVILRNPGLGFTVSGGEDIEKCVGQYDAGIVVTSVVESGPASTALKLGDKILEVNGIDFTRISRQQAVNILESSGPTVSMMVSRE